MIGEVLAGVGFLMFAAGLCLLAARVERWLNIRRDTVDRRYEQARELQHEHLRERAGVLTPDDLDREFRRVHESLLRELQATNPQLERQFRGIVEANGMRWSR